MNIKVNNVIIITGSKNRDCFDDIYGSFKVILLVERQNYYKPSPLITTIINVKNLLDEKEILQFDLSDLTKYFNIKIIDNRSSEKYIREFEKKK